jgi:AraC-like DNA-binding protein
MQYLTRWRMQCASRRLDEPGARVGAVAHAVGYESEAAFARAFKKAAGLSPAAWRNRSG